MRKKVPVSMAALMARINRKLDHDGKRFKASRSAGQLDNLGYYYTVDLEKGVVVGKNQNPEELARALEVIQPWEKLED